MSPFTWGGFLEITAAARHWNCRIILIPEDATDEPMSFHNEPNVKNTIALWYNGAHYDYLEPVAIDLTIPDEVLTQKGEAAKQFYIIISGEYKISFKDNNFVTLGKTGEFIGWATLIAAPNYIGTSVALTDGELLTLSGRDFLRLLQSDADLGNKIMEKGSEMAAKGKSFTKE